MSQSAKQWEQFALLLIDVQNDFWEGDMPEQFPHFQANTAKLLTTCREHGIEVIHIRAAFAPDKSDWMVPYKIKGSIPCIQGTEGVELLPCALEQPGEKVIIKSTFDAFVASELLSYLHSKDKKFLFTAGLVTSICVLFTTVSAVQHGFLTAVVEDCCADVLASHKQTLEWYSKIFMMLTGVDRFTGEYSRWKDCLDAVAKVDQGR